MKTIVSNKLENQNIVVKKGERVQYILIASDEAGENKVMQDRARISFDLSGDGAELSFIGFVIGRESNFYGFETVSNHQDINSGAKFNVAAVMYDRSKMDYKGNIVVPKRAQMTDAFLSSRVLLAGDSARARVIPCLEIEADDVKAGHSATIGKVDPEELFYLQSRGISKSEAEELLVMSFFESQLAMIEEVKTREHVADLVRKSLSLTK